MQTIFILWIISYHDSIGQATFLPVWRFSIAMCQPFLHCKNARSFASICKASTPQACLFWYFCTKAQSLLAEGLQSNQTSGKRLYRGEWSARHFTDRGWVPIWWKRG